MLNLIPVVMFLLMQGAGGDSLSLRQQQALLDLAHRATAARSHCEIESALTDRGLTKATGRYVDVVARDGAALRLRERVVVCDAGRIDTLLAIPL